MADRTVFMFAGQGSQFYGMGRELRSIHPVFDRSLRETDTMFADSGLPGILAEMHRPDRGVAEPFDRFAHTHPAILMVELALLDMLGADGVAPDHVLGSSLGEYTAAATAGAIDREQLARLVVSQVRLTEELCPRGGMLAVLGDVGAHDPEHPRWAGLEVAAVNYRRHFVVSGADDALTRLQEHLQADGTATARLPVRYAFHSSHVDAVAEPYQQVVATVPLAPPRIDLVSCATASSVTELTPASLWHTVRGTIRFAETIQHLEQRYDGLRYVDLGPAATLANFATQNLRRGSGSHALAVLDPLTPAEDSLALLRTGGAPRRAAPTVAEPLDPTGPRAVLFPGQGSQRVGMAEGLFAEFPDVVAEADDLLGRSVEELCLRDPRGELMRTELTQPALFVANALHYLAWQREHGEAQFLAGHSLGEYNALWAAGAVDFATGLRIVRRRGELMSAAAPGAMAAVIGLAEDEVLAVLARDADQIDVANVNSADQVVVSGPEDAVQRVREVLLAAGARSVVPLRVGGAFHSRYMAEARVEFERFLADQPLRAPQVPVIANVTGQPYPDDGLRPLLAAQLTSPVRWARVVHTLLSLGVEQFDEVGPGTVLTRLVTAIREEPPATAAVVAAAAVPASATPAAGGSVWMAAGQELGDPGFRADHSTRYAYACGSMYRGIASEEMVIAAGRAGLLGFFGTGGLEPQRVESAIVRIRSELGDAAPFGMGLAHRRAFPVVDDELVELFLGHGVHSVEASGFTSVTRALARYRLHGLERGPDGAVTTRHHLMVKIGRADLAEPFLQPVPAPLVHELLADGLINAEQADLAAEVAVADDLCAEADSGGHTEGAALTVLLPEVRRRRDRRARSGSRVRVGAAGGLASPDALAAAFVLGADFVLTGSVNLCTVEAGISVPVKEMLARVEVGDTGYVPADDGFEHDVQAQVLERGVFFPARARRLGELYRRHDALEEIDERTRTTLQERWFRRTFDDVWDECVKFFAGRDPVTIERAERDPKHKMALVFRWYLARGRRLAIAGDEEHVLDFQVQCGPALGAFNGWAAGTDLERWQDRRVDEIGRRLMAGAAERLAGTGNGEVAT